MSETPEQQPQAAQQQPTRIEQVAMRLLKLSDVPFLVDPRPEAATRRSGHVVVLLTRATLLLNRGLELADQGVNELARQRGLLSLIEQHTRAGKIPAGWAPAEVAATAADRALSTILSYVEDGHVEAGQLAGVTYINMLSLGQHLEHLQARRSGAAKPAPAPELTEPELVRATVVEQGGSDVQS